VKAWNRINGFEENQGYGFALASETVITDCRKSTKAAIRQ